MQSLDTSSTLILVRAQKLRLLVLFSLPWVTAAAFSETPRITGLVGNNTKIQCFSNSNLSVKGQVVDNEALANFCADMDSCPQHAAALFLPYALPVSEITTNALNVNLSAASDPCWVNRDQVTAVGLRVSTISGGDRVACDPHGGLGASACAKE